VLDSEAYGTSECIPSDQCGTARSIATVFIGIVIAISYIGYKSMSHAKPSDGIVDGTLSPLSVPLIKHLPTI
jgi:hypothetical protein